MDNEQIPVEETTDVSDVEQTSTDTSGSEDVEADKGDLRVPLKEERTKRQELEAQLNDPDFIYQKARELGLTEEEAQEAVDAQTTPEVKQPKGGYNEYQYYRSLEKAQEKYPDLEKDEDLQLMVTALINKGMLPEKAADKVFEKIQKTTEEAQKAGAAAERESITEKEKAQLASSSSNMSSSDAEMEQLQKDAKSFNRVTQEKAKIEILKRRM